MHIPPLTFLPLLPLLLRSGDHALRDEEDDRAEQEAAPRRRPAGGASATNFHVSGQNAELCTLSYSKEDQGDFPSVFPTLASSEHQHFASATAGAATPARRVTRVFASRHGPAFLVGRPSW